MLFNYVKENPSLNNQKKKKIILNKKKDNFKPIKKKYI
jgi:hypothetical protein